MAHDAVNVLLHHGQYHDKNNIDQSLLETVFAATEPLVGRDASRCLQSELVQVLYINQYRPSSLQDKWHL